MRTGWTWYGLGALLVTMASGSSRAWAGGGTLPDLLRRKGILTEDEVEGLQGKDAGVAPVDYDGGFVIRSRDGRHSLKINGRVALNFRFSEADTALPNTEAVDRARLGVTATFYRVFQLKLENDFTSSNGLRDAYFVFRPAPVFSLQAGQFKIPFSYEQLLSKRYIDFVERSAVVNSTMNPSRDIGVMAFGALAGERLQYQLAVMNGSGQNTSDDDGDKDLIGRLVVAPFAGTRGPLGGLEFGGAVTWGKQAGQTTRNADETTSFTANSIAGTTETGFTFFPRVARRGERIREGVHLAWRHGPFSVSGEYITTEEERSGLGPSREDLADLETEGAYTGATWMLTGEAKPDNARVRPDRPWISAVPALGAWEAAIRWEFFDLSHDADLPGEAEVQNRYDAILAGLNWYPNELLRFSVNYLYGHFDERGASRSPDPDKHSNHAVLCRAQLEF